MYAKEGERAADEESKYVPGTTWVFDDDDDKKKDMSIDDFASQFDKACGGEAFRKE